MKLEWRKHENNLYGAKKVPQLITVPMQSYIMIMGKGNPNNTDFSERVSALYSLAYAIKMIYKSDSAKVDSTNCIHDYTVYPLEGVWQAKTSDLLVKDDLEYTIMIRQPDFITKDMLDYALEIAKRKKPTALLDQIFFDKTQDDKCIEILHIGSFDDEPASFLKMDEFAKQNGFQRSQSYHREIYLNNANRVEQSKLQTILRYQVK